MNDNTILPLEYYVSNQLVSNLVKIASNKQNIVNNNN